jgi:pimeloyl-ACP methyl ester carboxylesterase
MSDFVTIPTHISLNLAGIYQQPTGNSPRPLVILLHGFTGYKEETHLVDLAERLYQANIGSVRIDAPGSGDSEGTWAEDYRLSNYVTVLPDIHKYAVTRLNADPRTIGVWGHSLGGFVALASAARHPDLFAAMVGSQLSSGHKMIGQQEETTWRTTGWAHFRNSHFPDINLPYAFLQDRQQYDALIEAPKLKVPSLFIAGTKDVVVTAASVKAIYEAAPQPKTYLEFPAAHDYKRDPQSLAAINKATIDFFVLTLRR